MEALAADDIPVGPEWQYEPKWDGFRCLVFREGDSVRLQSKSGQPLERYFPELVETIAAIPSACFVVDGEIVIPVGRRLSFDDLLQRIHPAASRVQTLAREHPAALILFDMLVDEGCEALVERPLPERRARLEAFAARLWRTPNIFVSPATRRRDSALKWYAASGGALDGVIAKRTDQPYRSGDRAGMKKIKHRRTADCVVGGFRYGSPRGASQVVGSLLLGLYDPDGRLHHVGYTSSLSASDRKSLTPKLEKLIKSPGFTGRAPGGPSRWSKRKAQWHPLRPRLVAEVEYDHFTGHRFRHGTKFLRWRPDKSPRQCTLDQIEGGRGSLLQLLGPSARLSPRAP